MTKKIMRLLLLMACFIMLFSYSAVAGIKGSKHDFSYPAGPGSSRWSGLFKVDSVFIEEICVFCHTPHNAVPATDNGMLWNRVNQDAGYSWNMYTSATLTAIVPTTRPTGVSLMCMSCHDGITSIGVGVLQNAPGSGNPADTFDPGTSGLTSDKIGGLFYVGGSLGAGPNIAAGRPGNTGWPLSMSNDHPISFEWPTGDSGLYTYSARLNPGKLRLFGTSGIRIECATCHSVHDNTIPPFLAVSNVGSGMCLSCHIK